MKKFLSLAVLVLLFSVSTYADDVRVLGLNCGTCAAPIRITDSGGNFVNFSTPPTPYATTLTSATSGSAMSFLILSCGCGGTFPLTVGTYFMSCSGFIMTITVANPSAGKWDISFSC